MKKIRNKGFTLSELLVVVAIIAVLVAISIPIFTSQLHKAKVATDWANLRALYSEIQTEYLSSQDDWSFVSNYKFTSSTGALSFDTITAPDGSSIKLEAGVISMSHQPDKDGYGFVYMCDKYDNDHMLIVKNDGIEIGN